MSRVKPPQLDRGYRKSIRDRRVESLDRRINYYASLLADLTQQDPTDPMLEKISMAIEQTQDIKSGVTRKLRSK